MQILLAVIDKRGRIEFPANVEFPWGAEGEVQYVVELVEPGCLRIMLLEKWAQTEGMAREDAAKQIEELAEADLSPGDVPGLWLVTVDRARRRGRPAYRASLPKAALWGLLRNGEGPLVPKRQKDSAMVLLRVTSDSLVLCSQESTRFVNKATD